MIQTLDRFAPIVFALLRLMTGLLFLEHGLVKLIGFPPGAYPGQQAVLSFAGLSAMIELVAGALIAMGLLTRLAAFIASGEMAVGYFMMHASKGFFPAANGGDAAILFCFVFLYFVTVGGGLYSFDHILAGRSNRLAPAGRFAA